MKGLLDELKSDFFQIGAFVAFCIFALNFIFLVIVVVVILFVIFGFIVGGVELVGLINEIGDVPFKVLFLSLVIHIVTKEFYKKAIKYIKENDE